jgi:cysteinyl-tRNA synthetase
LRYALVSNQYLQPMNFTFDALVQAKASVERIQARYERLLEAAGEGPASVEVQEIAAKQSSDFDAALADNLNMPNALAAVFGFVTELNQRTLSPGDAKAALAALEGFDSVLAVLDRRVRSGIVTKADLDSRAAQEQPAAAELLQAPLSAAAIEALVVRRHAAKKAKDFAQADQLRKDLDASGVTLEDLPAGVRWRVR